MSTSPGEPASPTNNADRERKLDQLVSSLSPHEWRYLRDRLNERSFSCDILASLPTELVILMLRELDLAQYFLIRRVSKKWYSLLSSDEICNTVFRHHFPDLSCQRWPWRGKSLLLSFARRHRQFRTGRFVNHVSLQFRQPSDTTPWRNQTPLLLHYVNGRIAYLEPQPGARNNKVKVWSLTTGQTYLVSSTHHETLGATTLADSFVGSLSFLGCFVSVLQTGQVFPIRLPNLHVTDIASAGNILIILLRDSFVIWDLETKKSRFCNAPGRWCEGGGETKAKALVLPDKNSLVIFSPEPAPPGPRPSCTTVFERFDFDGRSMSSGQMTHILSWRICPWIYPSGFQDEYIISETCWTRKRHEGDSFYQLVGYNIVQDELFTRTYTVDGNPRWDDQPVALFYWRDVLFSSIPRLDRPPKSFELSPAEVPATLPDDWLVTRIEPMIGDGHIIIRWTTDTIQIWSFDEGQPLVQPNGIQSYYSEFETQSHTIDLEYNGSDLHTSP